MCIALDNISINLQVRALAPDNDIFLIVDRNGIFGAYSGPGTAAAVEEDGSFVLNLGLQIDTDSGNVSF